MFFFWYLRIITESLSIDNISVGFVRLRTGFKTPQLARYAIHSWCKALYQINLQLKKCIIVLCSNMRGLVLFQLMSDQNSWADNIVWRLKNTHSNFLFLLQCSVSCVMAINSIIFISILIIPFDLSFLVFPAHSLLQTTNKWYEAAFLLRRLHQSWPVAFYLNRLSWEASKRKVFNSFILSISFHFFLVLPLHVSFVSSFVGTYSFESINWVSINK